MYLIDTNIFLEILLNQDKKEICKAFLKERSEKIYITDFSLHSIGVICFRIKNEELFLKFLEDILPYVEIITLPIDLYPEITKKRKILNLDFDDSYQYQIAKHFGLTIVTMDSDFKKVESSDVLFL